MERGIMRSVGEVIRPFADARGVVAPPTKATRRRDMTKKEALRLYNRSARLLGHGASDREFHKTLIGLSKDADYRQGREVVVGQSNEFLSKCCNMAKTTFTDQLRKHDGKTIRRRKSGNGHRFVARDKSDSGDGRVTYHNAISLEPMIEKLLELIPILDEQEEMEADLRQAKARASASVRSIKEAALRLADNEAARRVSEESKTAAVSLRRAVAKADLGEARALADMLEQKAYQLEDMDPRIGSDRVEIPISEVSETRHELHLQEPKENKTVMLGEGERQGGAVPMTTMSNPADEWRPAELAELFPTMGMYLPAEQPVNWSSIRAAGTRLLQPLGINRSCWIEAEEVMGPYNRYVALGLVAELVGAGRIISTPGRYFNGMVRKARTGELDLRRSVWRIRKEKAGTGGRMISRRTERHEP